MGLWKWIDYNDYIDYNEVVISSHGRSFEIDTPVDWIIRFSGIHFIDVSAAVPESLWYSKLVIKIQLQSCGKLLLTLCTPIFCLALFVYNLT